MTPAQRQRLATRLIETIGEAGTFSVALGPGRAGGYVVEVLDLAVAPSRLVAVGEGPTYWAATARAVADLLDEPVEHVDGDPTPAHGIAR